jgi:hypothetical protein
VSDLRTDIAHSARIYDYLLGGKDNFAADRAAAEKMIESTPGLPISMRANRRFMARVAEYLAREAGIRQFLDVGTGLPTRPNLHEVVQAVDPTAKVVYVDNDPLVLVHARALLVGTDEGQVAYLDADLRHPETILEADTLTDLIDFDQPVALTLIAVLQHVTDDEVARGTIARLTQRFVPGSALVLSIVTTDNDPRGSQQTITTYNKSGVPVMGRTYDQVLGLFEGFELLDPGVVWVHQWQPAEEDLKTDGKDVYMYGGVAFKR